MINVDPLELEKFSELAHRWWDPHAEFKPLHDINPLRLDSVDGIAGLRGTHVLATGWQVDYRLIAPEVLAREAPHAFDVVTCMELLEHVPDPAVTVKACAE